MTTASEHVRPPRERLAGLDALRGVAALCVIFQHAAQFTVDYTALYAPVLEFINLGRFGVILFFLISGFVVPSSLACSGLSHFAVNRAFRLLPVLWVSILALGIRFALLDVDFSPTDLLANMTMLAWPLGRFQLSIGYWTLSVELGFYLLIALLFALGQLRNFRLFCAFGLLFALFGALVNREPIVFYGYLLAGMAVRQVCDGNRDALPWSISLFGVLIFATLQLAIRAPHTGFLQSLPLATGMIAPIPVFLFIVIRRPNISGPLLWAGAISYPLYLLQDLALYGLRPINHIFAPVYPVAVFATTICLAALVHHFVEQPGVKLGRIFNRRRILRIASA